MSSSGACGNDASSVAQDTNLIATITAWRERGADSLDPVRFRFMEALARRAATHGGKARRMLDDKLAKLIATYGDDLESARCANGSTSSNSAAPWASATGSGSDRGALAELVDHIAGHPTGHGDSGSAGDAGPRVRAPTELKTLSHFRDTWSRLRLTQRLTQSLAKVPENAGPLNSHHLVHRSLTLMRDLSPEYLARFMSYVDALLWLDQANGAGALERKDAPRTDSDRKPPRRRMG